MSSAKRKPELKEFACFDVIVRVDDDQHLSGFVRAIAGTEGVRFISLHAIREDDL
jgi:hypothetical protein